MQRIAVSTILVGLALIAAIGAIAAGKTVPLDGRPSEADYLVRRQPAVKSSPVSISPDANIERVIVKLVEGARGRLAGGRIHSLGGKETGEINRIISQNSRGLIRRLTRKAPDRVESERLLLEKKTGHRLADMNNYFVIPVSSAAEAENLVNLLNRLPQVEIAYAEPRPTVAVDIEPPTPDYDTAQAYLRPAPGGIDADYARTILGGGGTGVRVVDVEGNWKFDHEDLELSPDRLLGGTLVSTLEWRHHGTAVIGILGSEANDYGVTGIVPDADLAMVSVGGISMAEAVLIAADSLQPGDIILIELQAAGPRYDFAPRPDQLGYICMEYWQANFDAMQLAWAKGMIVCEAAGNGAENLDDLIYENRFDTAYRNSHAILCGAGAPPSGNHGIDRSRLSFSNYGQRVNLQGQGRELVTAGYGDLFDGNYDERQYYTADFGGTSGATPIVAGAAAALQGIYLARYGVPLDSDRMRNILVATGSPQQSNTGEHIGPRPDLKAADSALPAPPDLSVFPQYFDTTVEHGTQMSVYFDMTNVSAEKTLEYSITTEDSLLKDGLGDWLIVPNPNGSLSPSTTEPIEAILDATVIDDRTQIYKGLITISYGESGGALDEQAVIPVFIDVPCADTTYAVRVSSEPEGPDFRWSEITGSWVEVPPFAWYNPFVETEIIDDGTIGPIYIGFVFPFYDSTFKYAFIGANGGLSFTDTNVNVDGFYATVPIPNPPFATFVSPFWNDLNMDPDAGGHGGLYYYRSSPRDTFMIRYHQVGNFNDPDDTLTSFQIVLTKNGNITFHYLTVGISGLADSAVVGLAETDCACEPYVIQGVPPEHLISDSTAILFDYAYVVWDMSGDINSDGDINISDAVYLITWIFKGGPAPKRTGEADVNCDGTLNIADAVYIVSYIFQSGPEPCQYGL